MAEIHERRISESKLDTVMAEDIVFEGMVSFNKELMIKGKYTGNINSTGDLYITADAEVEADIVADTVYIQGRVKGNIRARIQG